MFLVIQGKKSGDPNYPSHVKAYLKSKRKKTTAKETISKTISKAKEVLSHKDLKLKQNTDISRPDVYYTEQKTPQGTIRHDYYYYESGNKEGQLRDAYTGAKRKVSKTFETARSTFTRVKGNVKSSAEFIGIGRTLTPDQLKREETYRKETFKIKVPKKRPSEDVGFVYSPLKAKAKTDEFNVVLRYTDTGKPVNLKDDKEIYFDPSGEIGKEIRAEQIKESKYQSYLSSSRNILKNMTLEGLFLRRTERERTQSGLIFAGGGLSNQDFLGALSVSHIVTGNKKGLIELQAQKMQDLEIARGDPVKIMGKALFSPLAQQGYALYGGVAFGSATRIVSSVSPLASKGIMTIVSGVGVGSTLGEVSLAYLNKDYNRLVNKITQIGTTMPLAVSGAKYGFIKTGAILKSSKIPNVQLNEIMETKNINTQKYNVRELQVTGKKGGLDFKGKVLQVTPNNGKLSFNIVKGQAKYRGFFGNVKKAPVIGKSLTFQTAKGISKSISVAVMKGKPTISKGMAVSSGKPIRTAKLFEKIPLIKFKINLKSPWGDTSLKYLSKEFTRNSGKLFDVTQQLGASISKTKGSPLSKTVSLSNIFTPKKSGFSFRDYPKGTIIKGTGGTTNVVSGGSENLLSMSKLKQINLESIVLPNIPQSTPNIIIPTNLLSANTFINTKTVSGTITRTQTVQLGKSIVLPNIPQATPSITIPINQLSQNINTKTVLGTITRTQTVQLGKTIDMQKDIISTKFKTEQLQIPLPKTRTKQITKHIQITIPKVKMEHEQLFNSGTKTITDTLSLNSQKLKTKQILMPVTITAQKTALKSRSLFNINPIVDITPPDPTPFTGLGLPPLMDFNIKGTKKTTKKSKKKKIKNYNYAPSLGAVVLNVTAPKIPKMKMFTGGEVRPMVKIKRGL